MKWKRGRTNKYGGGGVGKMSNTGGSNLNYYAPNGLATDAYCHGMGMNKKSGRQNQDCLGYGVQFDENSSDNEDDETKDDDEDDDDEEEDDDDDDDDDEDESDEDLIK